MDTGALPRDFKDDPSAEFHSSYARLRDSCPVQQIAQASGMRPFLVTRHEDAKAALADQRLSKDPRTGERALREAGLGHIYFSGRESLSHHMLAADPPDHTWLRRAVSASFTPRRIAGLEPQIRRITDDLIAVFEDAGQTELMASFANQLPALVIAELLGVPAADRDTFRSWSQDTLRPPQDPEQRVAHHLLTEYLVGEIAGKRAAPGEDLISALLSGADADRLDEREVVSTALLLLLAGHETTVNLIGNGTLALLTHPDQLALLREQPRLIPEAVEEFLRYDGPVDRATLRFAAEDLQIADVPIPEGSIVYVALSSANRDGDAFEDPDTLDVTRAPRGHLAFGHGIHFCLGAPLARLEARIAFETLLGRLPDLRLAVPSDQLKYRPSTIMRGLEALPVTFTPPAPRTEQPTHQATSRPTRVTPIG
ncbi:MAG: cytochrome P450 family protein [Actinocrinis sp.]